MNSIGPAWSLEAAFRCLGLPRDECRVEIIRAAATRRGRQIKRLTARSDRATQTAATHTLATSTYRLLDPRRRQASWERIVVGRIQAEPFEGFGGPAVHQPTDPQRQGSRWADPQPIKPMTPFERYARVLSSDDLVDRPRWLPGRLLPKRFRFNAG